jgi:hypothetical protein
MHNLLEELEKALRIKFNPWGEFVSFGTDYGLLFTKDVDEAKNYLNINYTPLKNGVPVISDSLIIIFETFIVTRYFNVAEDDDECYETWLILNMPELQIDYRDVPKQLYFNREIPIE